MGLSIKERLDRESREQLEALVALCLAVLAEYDDKELANYTYLSVSTIRRLRTGQFTINVRMGTIQALARAAGLTLLLDRMNVNLSKHYKELVKECRRK